MKSELIFFCGPHCSGKSSLLGALYEEGIFSFYGHEIGKELFYQRKFATEEQNEQFEFEVSVEELKRDMECAKMQGLLGIETWHPGNLAYAMVRNPNSVSKLISYMKESPFINNAYGIRLIMPLETIVSRTKTFKDDLTWAVDFYTKIDNSLDSCLVQLGLKDRCVCINAAQEFEDVIREVKKAIEGFFV